MQLRHKFFTNPFILDLRALALLRIGVGLLILADLAIRTPDLSIWLTDSGILSREKSIAYSPEWRWSLYWLNGGALWAGFLTAVAAGFSMMLTLGIRTRLASIVSLLFLISLHNRNPLLLQGGDNLLLLLLFWGCFLPWGERASIDASMVRTTRISNDYFGAPGIALVLQVLSVYFFSALLKTGEEWITDGTAIYYALHLDQYAFGLAPIWRDWHGLTQLLSHYVWWLELLAPPLALLPIWFIGFRGLAVFLLIALEVGFLFNLRIGLFPLISIISLCALIPPALMDRLWRSSPRSGPAIQIYFDKDCSFCEKICYLLKYLLGLRSAQISAAQDHEIIGPVLERENSWVVVDEDKNQRLRWDALTYVVQCSPRFSWISSILSRFNDFGDRVYIWIGNHRFELSRTSARWLPWRDQYPRAGKFGSITAATIALLVLWHNFSTIEQWNPVHGLDTGVEANYRIPSPDFFMPFYLSLRLDQRWGMFAPYPQKENGWFISPGLLADGSLIALNDNGGDRAPSGARPSSWEDQFENYRWRKYYSRLWEARYSEYRLAYGSWLCRSWSKRHDNLSPLEAFDFYFISDFNQPPGEPGVQTPIRLTQYHCKDVDLLAAEPVSSAIKESNNIELIEILGIDKDVF